MTDDRRESSFDELAKGLASGDVSRGRALRLMGAALVGGTLASVPGMAWAAPRPRPDGKKCKRDSQCQSGNCAGGVCQGIVCPDGCFSFDRVDGTGQACINCSSGCQAAPDCNSCPEGTICVVGPGGSTLCGVPC